MAPESSYAVYDCSPDSSSALLADPSVLPSSSDLLSPEPLSVSLPLIDSLPSLLPEREYEEEWPLSLPTLDSSSSSWCSPGRQHAPLQIDPISSARASYV